MQTICSFGPNANETWLASAGFYLDTPGAFDKTLTSAAPPNVCPNKGYDERRKFFMNTNAITEDNKKKYSG